MFQNFHFDPSYLIHFHIDPLFQNLLYELLTSVASTTLYSLAMTCFYEMVYISVIEVKRIKSSLILIYFLIYIFRTHHETKIEIENIALKILDVVYTNY